MTTFDPLQNGSASHMVDQYMQENGQDHDTQVQTETNQQTWPTWIQHEGKWWFKLDIRWTNLPHDIRSTIVSPKHCTESTEFEF